MATQAPKKTETNQVNVFDTLWDGWLNSIKLTHAYQREMEAVSVQAIERQKEIWQRTRENLNKVEQELNKFVSDSKTSFYENVKNVNGIAATKHLEDWTKRAEEVLGKIQQVYGTPGKAGESLIDKSLDQLDSTVKDILTQQQKSREEVQSLLENFTEQVKKTNKGLLESWEASRATSYNIFK
jgi:thymidylate synthase